MARGLLVSSKNKIIAAIKSNPLRNPKRIPNRRFPEKLQPIAFIAFFVTKAPINSITAKIIALANHNLNVSEAPKVLKMTAKFSSKLKAAQIAITQVSNENNSDKRFPGKGNRLGD